MKQSVKFNNANLEMGREMLTSGSIKALQLLGDEELKGVLYVNAVSMSLCVSVCVYRF